MENTIPPASVPASDGNQPQRLDFAATLAKVRECPVMSDEEIAYDNRQRKLAIRDANVKALKVQAGPRLSACRFSNFIIKSPYQQTVVETLKEWVSTFDERRKAGDGIVLYGPVGTGKDHLAFSAVGEAVFTSGATAKWVNGRELVGTIRDRISEDASENVFIRSMEAPTILVVSDPLPPIGDLTQHQADMLYRICEARYGAKKITVATLNVADDDEADRRLGAATWDRMCHGAWKVACMWQGFRAPARDVKP